MIMYQNLRFSYTPWDQNFLCGCFTEIWAGHLESTNNDRSLIVYTSPKFHSHNIFLVPGTSYVLTGKGGPTIVVHVIWMMKQQQYIDL